MRALKDSINLLAKLNITANAERITLTAKTELVIQGGGSATTYNAAGITHVTTGPYTAHAANFAYTSAKNLAGVFPEPPKPGEGDLQLFNQYAGQQGIQGGGFEVIDALGQRLKGSLDAKGFAAVPGAAPGPGRVAFGKDPADTWADGSFIGTPEWPVMPPSAGEAPAPLDAAVGEGLPTKNWDVAHVMTAAVDAGAAGLGLPPLATAALPIAAGLLSGAIKSGKLPSLRVPTVDEDLLEVSGLLAGEKLS
ncbi:hypothetical protein AO263_34490 [Pseudomonas sp. NZIPFR-PS5]|nr:hypothetical protein AO263_34490 [Pseudomonas sp. NZIPFR-PS5]